MITLDESTYQSGKHKYIQPIIWQQEFEGGRIWYPALGHRSESYRDENFLKHIVGGIEWTSGK